MKEYICNKDFYINDVKFASVGDHVLLLPDNTTVVNKTNGQKVVQYPDLIDSDSFSLYFDNIKEDRVNHPKHYTWLKKACGVEVIEITRHMDFDLGNAIKYILRSGHKRSAELSDREKTIEDLQKAIWYIKDEINLLKDGI